MSEGYETHRLSKEEFSKKQPHELLVQLGGAMAILLALVTYLTQTPLKFPVPITPTTSLLVNMVLGAAMVFTGGTIMQKNVINGAIVTAIVSVILIAFGDKSGTIGGIIGILGAIVGMASPYLPRPHEK